MRTLLTVKQQQAFLRDNEFLNPIEHRWSSRGLGNSKIIDGNDVVISKASGCGYDRCGKALGDFVEATFPDELQRLAKRFCKDKGLSRKSSVDFYGLYVTKNGDVILDGACGSSSVIKVLNAIGFDLERVAGKSLTNNGYEFFNLVPVSNRVKKYILKDIK